MDTHVKRCKICQLNQSKKAEVEEMIRKGISLRKTESRIRKAGHAISYGSINRHKRHMFCNLKRKHKARQNLTTTSFSIEEEILKSLANEEGTNLSEMIDHKIYRWLSKNSRREDGVRELGTDIFTHRITCGWIKDQRRKLRKSKIKSITIALETKRLLQELKSSLMNTKEYKEEAGFWVRHPNESLYTLVWPCYVIAETASLGELMNGILRLVLGVRSPSFAYDFQCRREEVHPEFRISVQ